MENEKINLNVAPGTAEVVIRHGKALEVRNPVAVSIKGTIDAPLRYLKNRISTLNVLVCMIVVSLVDGMITLTIEEHSENADEIAGEIKLNPNITSFGINNGKYITPEDMSNFLRMRKHLFESEAKYMEVFTALRTFTAKVNQQIAAIRDDTGNFEQKRQQAVEHNLPKGFRLNLPIFIGMPKVAFDVEVLVNKSLDVTLYSAELIQMEEELRDQYIKEVVAEIEKAAPGIVILYQ